MVSIKITSKRQATFPREVCKDLGVVPGDELFLERLMVKGELCWVVKTASPKIDWIASLKHYTKNKSHQMTDIRKSIANGRRG